MKFDNERDRNTHGYDAGLIVDGIVQKSLNTGTYVIVDDEGVGFDPQAVLAGLEGKKVRVTIISFEAIESITDMVKKAQEDVS
jgi:hypothetical protein